MYKNIPSENKAVLSELRHIKEAIEGIEQQKKILRILFHPNANFQNSLKDRIEIYSSGQDKCVEEYGSHAILTDKGHLVYEISQCNPKWKHLLLDNENIRNLLSK